MRLFSSVALLIYGLKGSEYSLSRLPHEVKVHIARHLGSHSDRAFQRAYSENVDIVTTARELGREDEVAEIHSDYLHLMQKTSITAEQIFDFFVWSDMTVHETIPHRTYGQMEWREMAKNIEEHPFVFGRGIVDEFGRYLMIKVVCSISRTPATMLFTFDGRGYLTSYRFFNCIECRCYHWSWAYELSKFCELDNPVIRRKMHREWQSKIP